MPMLSTKPLNGADICIWPDDTWCSADELPQYSHMSDDYIRLPVDSEIWMRFTEGQVPRYDEVVQAIRDELEGADRGG